MTQVLRIEVFELYELDNVSHGWFSACIPQNLLISVQLNHIAEIFISNAHYNDTKRVLRAFNDQICGLSHVMNNSISEDKQNVIHWQLYISFHVVQDNA